MPKANGQWPITDERSTMSKRPKEALIPVRGRGKPAPEKGALQQKVPPPQPERRPLKTPTANRRGR